MQRLFRKTVTTTPRLTRPNPIAPKGTFIQAQKAQRTIRPASTMADITPIQTKEACPGIYSPFLSFPIPNPAI